MLIALCIILLSFMLVLKIYQKQTSAVKPLFKLGKEQKVLLVIAHPDDECIFFSPTILYLIGRKIDIYILCLSTGDYYNQGESRVTELYRSCNNFGISLDKVYVLNEFQDDPTCLWETESVAKTVQKHVVKSGADVVLTFDEKGISRHLNHISVFHGVRYFRRNCVDEHDKTRAYRLITVNVLRKYTQIHVHQHVERNLVMTPRGRTFFARRMRKHFFVIACVSLALITVVTRCAVLVMRRRAGVDARHARFRAITDHVDRTFRLSERELTLDASGAYVVHSDVNDGVDAVGAHDVTAVTHCTAANLAYLPRLVHAWNGPMSVSVYIDNLGVFERVVRAFAVCNVGALSKVRFHMVRPLRERASRHFDRFRVADFSSPSMLCDGLRALLELHQGANYEEAEYPYPSNLLRNVAHTASRTDYVLHVDIDLLPSRHLRARFNRFAASSQPGDLTVAYVLPVFEVDSTTEFPDDEQQVAAWVDRGAARPFYWRVCPRCQNRTDYVRWLALSSSPSDTCRAVYDVHWEWSYEPFYVSRRLSLPAFDERFRRYGYNRASHLCELHVAGTTFRVLHPLFLTHLGFKRNFHPRKREEQRANRVRYAHFIAGLKVKYPASNRTCEEQPLYSLL